MALLRDAHLGCAVTWQGKVDIYWVCSHLCVCVYMSDCVWICASLSQSVVLHVTVPVCISRNASLVKWGSTHHVVSCVCCCHGSRLPREEIRWKGRGEHKRRTVKLDSMVYLSDLSMRKTIGTAEKLPTTHCSLNRWENHSQRDTKIWMNIMAEPPPWTVTLLWWRSLRALMTLEAMLSGAFCPW